MTKEFRFWNTVKKKFHYPQDLAATGAFITLSEFNSAEKMIIQQFTGLFDKNGNKIFEGDICAWFVGLGTVPYKIKPIGFEEGAFMFNFEAPRYHRIPLHGFTKENDKIKSLEVIGNIFENPELLK